MGSVSLKIDEGTARFKKPTICSSPTNLLMIFSVITTNLFALYAFKYSPKPHNHHIPNHHHHTHKTISLISEQVSFILKEINSSQNQLSHIENRLLGFESIDFSTPNIPKELKLFLNRNQLPLGKDSRTGITEMVSSVGHSCVKSIGLLSEFMNYSINGVCPHDLGLSQKLISRGCEPLPRRRCLSKIHHSLDIKKLNGGCFDLVKGYESQRFLKPRGKNDFLIDEVLGLGGNGGIRIGLDIGGGCGAFAARMAEKNVTIVTTTLNIGAPFSEFIASRGLFPLFLSLDHRFPFYENVFDIIRAGNGLDFGGDRMEKSKLEFLMFDVDRVLRPGGLLWLDNFLCANDEKRRDLTRLIKVFGYKKHKWVVGEKVNRSGKSDVYLSAVLQKPVRA